MFVHLETLDDSLFARVGGEADGMLAHPEDAAAKALASIPSFSAFNMKT